MIGVENIKNTITYEHCTRENYEDSNLNKWVAVNLTSESATRTKTAYVIDQVENHVIYCLFSNITIDGLQVPCPNYASKLSIEHSFSVGNFSHVYNQQNETVRQIDKKPGEEAEIEIDETYVETNRLINEYAQLIHRFKSENEPSDDSREVIRITSIAGCPIIILMAVAYYFLRLKKAESSASNQTDQTDDKPEIPPRNHECRGLGECRNE